MTPARIITRLRVLGCRITGQFRRRSLDRRLDEEVQHHLEFAAADHVARGMPPDEARLAALRSFGGVIRTKEQYRETRGLPWLDTLAQDLRYAVRVLVKNPGFTAVAVLSLGLGIGANAAIFGLIDTLFLQSLPVMRPNELVVFASEHSGRPTDHAFTYEMFQASRKSRSLVDLFASTWTRMQVDIDGSSEPTVQGELVSGSYYAVLGVRPALGRLIGPDDEARERPVAVLSHAYWQRRFGGDAEVLNRTVRINGYPCTVVGVSAAEFSGTRVGQPADISVPLVLQVHVMPDVGANWAREGSYQMWLGLMGRLRPGVARKAAQAELDIIYQQHMEVLREVAGPKRTLLGNPTLALEPGATGVSALRPRYSRPLAVMMGVVALVLLIACANAANLLLARSIARRREIAVRVALGAGRRRIARQLITESLVLAFVSGGAGLLFAWWGTGPMSTLLAGEQLRELVARPDARVLAFTLAASLVTGLLFGVLPALAAARADPQPALKDAAGGAGGRHPRAAAGLVGAQVAVSLMLLTGAGLFIRTLVNLRSMDLGIEQERVLALRLEPLGSNQKRNPDGTIKADLLRTYGTLVSRAESLPGVRAVTLAGATPLGNENQTSIVFRAPGYLPKPGEDLRLRMIQIYPNYFSTLGIRLVAGRDLTSAENEEAAARRELALAETRQGAPARAIVINRTMARRFFGGDIRAIGQRFSHGEVVGVVEDVRDRGPREPVTPLMYVTYAQAPTGRGQMTLLVRTTGDPHTVAAAVRQLAQSIDPNMPLLDIQTVAERVDGSISQERLLALLSSLFGLVALVLASIGLYGVMAYAVSRRRAEFGLRMALGATRAGLVRMVVRESLVLVGAGIAVGVPATLAASGFIANRLYGVSAADPATMAGASALLVSVAVVAVLVPARRAAKADPLVALRSE